MSCSSDEQSDKECPLCMEQLEIDDLDFYPCKCEYQICRFCWHRLLTDENGLCPACRQPYPEDPVTFKPLSCADVQRIKDEKRMKQQAEKLRISESRNHLANYRVLQKNLVYVVGLSPRVADPDTLRKPEYFGRFGKILKVVVGTAPTANHPHAQPSHTAYVTYSKVEEALRAIQAVCNAQLDGRIVKASLGTTKYCSSFLRSQKCFKPECMYLHEIADSDISFTKEDMHMGKHAEYEKRLIDTVLNKTVPQTQERRTQAWVNNKNNICWEQNGSETSEETENTRDGGYNGGDESPSGDPTPSEAFGSRERQSSHDKENIPKRSKVKQSSPPSVPNTPAVPTPPPSSPPREPTPPSLDYITPEPETVSETKPPSSKTAEHSKPFNSIYNQDTESKLLRLLCGNEDSGTGMIPAPAPVSEAPAPLVNWQTLLGLSPQTTMSNTTTPYASSMLHSPMTPQKTLVTTPPPGLGGFTSDDDLGFDPFNESSKGLARLLEEEEKIKQPTIASYVNHHLLMQQQQQQQQQQLFSLRDLWSRPASLFPAMNTTQPQTTPLDMFAGLMTSHQQSQQQQQLHHQLHQPPNHNHLQHNPTHQQQHRQQFDPYCAPPPGLTPPQRPAMTSQSISEWQEGLKALLPNVNEMNGQLQIAEPRVFENKYHMFVFCLDEEIPLSSGIIMCDPFSNDFDASTALERSPTGGDEDIHGSLEDFERALVAEYPEIAQKICELDLQPGEKSRKQQKRERIERLQLMTASGRELFEKQVKPQKSLVNLYTLQSQWSVGPMSLLYRALRESLRIEIHIRAWNRIDRIAQGYLVAFDRHVNVVLRDVDEVALPGRREERAFGRRRAEKLYLPIGMRWHSSGTWPRPLGTCRNVLQRRIPCSMIKGDAVVLIRLMT
ncbi:hypothetical protein RB195_002119 [Necator americanus]|uniref:CCR4-NOT transcription complex subunit 4 n=1 Tax=Necator americanus TaxID=51031 RepID=A0ABR1DIV9_NECAM